jgi:transposase InsO family protein
MAREEVPMSLRRLIVEVDPKTLNVTAFCAEHGFSPWFFWDLRRRFAAEGDTALEPKSRAPHRVANRTPDEIEDLIVAKRKELADAGLDYGAEKIAWHLRAEKGVPTASTIARILRRRGFIIAEPKKAPKHAHKTFNAERANDMWQLDDTTWALADGAEVKILNVIDDHSRLLVASAATRSCTGAFALETLATAAVVLGWPARFLSDNAGAFRGVLADALRPLGIAAGHGRPYHPETQGKVERFHQTLKKWLCKQPPAATVVELQAQLDHYRHIYNHHRPHDSLGNNHPAAVWEAAPKNGPASRPLTEPTELYRRNVHGGVVWLGQRWRIAVGAKHNGKATLTVLTGLACHVFANGELIRALTIDPTRKHQPLHNRPGRPPTVRDVPPHV